MARDRQGWLKSGLTFCGSCAVSLAYWAVWLVLGGTLIGLSWILFAHELPVPDLMLRRLEAKFEQANFAIKIDRARFDPTGQVLLENVEIRAKRFQEPLLKSRLVYFRRSFLSILAGRPLPDVIELEGATLQLPAILSPSGAAEPVIQDLALRLRHGEETQWFVEQASGRIKQLRFTLEGEFQASIKRRSHVLSLDELLTHALEFERGVVRQADHLQEFDGPSLELRLKFQEGVGNVVTFAFTAAGAKEPWKMPVSLGPCSAAGSLRLDGTGERIVRIPFAAQSVRHPQFAKMGHTAGVSTFRYFPEQKKIIPLTVEANADTLVADEETISNISLRAVWDAWPEIEFSTTLALGGECLAANVSTNLQEKAATIRLQGTGEHRTINRILRRHLPRAAPYFVFGEPVWAKVEAKLGPEWKFREMTSRVSAGTLDSRGVAITSAAGRIDIRGMSFTAYDATVRIGESFARGSYWMDFLSTDYRMLLKGRITPQKIQGWFNGSWWSDFWDQRFSFPGPEPVADVDVQGRWRDATRTEYFGEASCALADVWGGSFEHVEATVFLRPLFVDVIQFYGARVDGGQYLKGNLRRSVDLEQRLNSRVEFTLDGNVDRATYHGMLEGKADEILAPFKFGKPPQIKGTGRIDTISGRTIPTFSFHAESADRFSYYDFPIERAAVSGAVAGNNVVLSTVDFNALGGKGTGKASVTGSEGERRLGFDFYLNGADLPRAIVTVQEFEDLRSQRTQSTPIDSTLIRRVAGGKIDLALSAQGNPNEFNSFNGTGNAAVTGANLAEIQLFGLLSQVLSGFSLRFSSLKLDSAHTSFRLEKGRLRFPDLKITGPSAAIEAHGDFAFANNAVDFVAKFKPFEESQGLFTSAIGIVITPITSIFELKLGGNLAKPIWSIDLGSTSSTVVEPKAPPAKTDQNQINASK